MTKIIGKISICLAVMMLVTMFFAMSVMAAVIDFSEVTTPETAYLACETVEKNATEYKVGETITFRIEFRSGNDLVSVPKFNYSIKAEDGSGKNGTVSGENGYFEVSTSISKPGLVQITVTPRNEDYTELKNGTSSYSMVGGACADLENIKMVMAEPDDFDEYWDAAIDELHTVFPNILKIEKGTAFYERYPDPDDDFAADCYAAMQSKCEQLGFKQYEISNFAKDASAQGQHNLGYWRCEEYLGIGPSAHSFMNGRRFYFEADTEAFIATCDPWLLTVNDGEGGSDEEKLMLGLRLAEGVDLSAFDKNFTA
ncbi:MAG: hypothetical protein IKK94_02135 [Clostridia bacterium]|nr:hypothetical protein [Clostridia bacterium]